MKSDADVFGAGVMDRLAVRKRKVPTIGDPSVDDPSAQSSIQPLPKTADTTGAPSSSTQPLSKAQLDGRVAPSDASVFGADAMAQISKAAPSYNGNENGGNQGSSLDPPVSPSLTPPPSTTGFKDGLFKPVDTKSIGGDGSTVKTSNLKTGGFNAPAVTTDRTGAPPPGYDPTKWADKAHQSPKYAVGGIVADAIAKGARDMTPEILSKLNEAYPGTTQVNGTTVNIPGVGEVQVINDGRARWDPAGSFGPASGGGPAGGGDAPGIEDAYGVPQVKLPPSLTGGGSGAVPGYTPFKPDFSGLGGPVPTTPLAQANPTNAPTANPADTTSALGAPVSPTPISRDPRALGAPVQSTGDTTNALGAPVANNAGGDGAPPNPIGPPGVGPAGGGDTTPPIGPPGTKTPAQTAAEAALAKILGGPSSEDIANNIGTDAAVSGHRLTAKREFDKLRAQGAENAAQGGTASSGGFAGQVRGLGQAEAEGNAQFAGTRVAEAVKERNQQLMQGIQIATASGDADKARALTQLMHDQDLKQNGEQFFQQLGFNYAQMNQQQKQFAAQLGQEDAHFGATLTQNQKQFLDSLGLNYAQLTSQQKLAVASLAQQNAQFNKQLGFNYTGLENDANYKELLLALGGGK